MKNEKLYPELSENGKKEAEKLLEDFKLKLKESISEVANDIMSDFYCNTLVYIESDSWTNFRNEIMDGMNGYSNEKILQKYNFKQVRDKIFEENKDEIISMISDDIIEENNRLRDDINNLIFNR